MDQATDQHNKTLRSLLDRMAAKGVNNAARGMAEMVGQTLAVSEPSTRLVPLAEIPNLLGGPESEAVGIYFLIDGDLSGQILMVVPLSKSLELVDLLFELPNGTTQQLGTLERSALAELGNVTGSFFLNSVADYLHISARPSPPAVVVDMIGAIINVILAASGSLCEDVLMTQVTFLRGDRETQAEFWVIPDRCTLAALVEAVSASAAESALQKDVSEDV